MNKICKFYVKGDCYDGEKCIYKHIDNVCRQYFLNKSCKRNDNCRFKHIENNRKRGKNTESFEPNHTPDDMRLVVGNGKTEKFNNKITSRDVIVIKDLFCDIDDLTIYNNLLDEIKKNNENEKVWKLWHGDTHLIADDHTDWKKCCPTFNMIIEKISNYFDMDVKATRLNWYRDSNEWKPYHHDAAAVKKDKAKTQNFTVGVSFGLERDASFEHATHRTRITVPLENGTVYTFSDIVNIEWRHGILQYPKDKYVDKGRISIIAWGKVDY